MRTPIALAAIAAAFLIGLSFASPQKPEPAINPLQAKIDEQAKQVTSLEFDVQNLHGECLTYKGQLDDAKTQLDSLRVQLAAATAKPSQSLTTSLPVSGAACEMGNCRVQPAGVVETWQPVQRRGLFNGRFRR